MFDLDTYQSWQSDQVCVDCGRAYADTDELWVTEIQCFACFQKLGPTEGRGKGSADDKFSEYKRLNGNLLKAKEKET